MVYRKFSLLLIVLNLLFLLLFVGKDCKKDAWMHFLLNGTDESNAVESSAGAVKNNEDISAGQECALAMACMENSAAGRSQSVYSTDVLTGTTLNISCRRLEKQYLVELTQEERNMLERIVEAEAGGEDLQGKILVANVVLNRLQSSSFPDTLEGVIFQHRDGVYQFSPVRDGRYYSVVVSEESKEAVERALLGEDQSRGALYFMARNATSNEKARWFDSSLTRLFSYGGHEFFAAM